MKTLTLSLILWASLTATAFALNEMTLVGQFEGENSNDWFGKVMTMGDFDNDGYDEFFIGAEGWPNGSGFGKNYYYEWCGDWPAQLTWTFQGTMEHWYYDYVDQNVGDINGDGIDDFGLTEHHPSNLGRLDFLFGSADFDSLADWSMWSEGYIAFFGSSLDSLGDVNGDGGNDFIFSVSMYTDLTSGFRLYFGGAALDTIVDWTYYFPSFQYGPVHGLGDVNGDGFNDFLILILNYYPPLLFFGGSPLDTIPDLIFYDYSVGGSGGGVGDVNEDGYSDFCISLRLPDSTLSHAYIYFGGPDVDNIPDVTLQDHWGGGVLESCYVLSHGDYNGDGYSDIADFTGDLIFGNIVYIYLGSPYFNPVPDALMTDWSVYQGFGEALASGDVNGDGRDELLVCAMDPIWYWGEVYLFEGPETWIDYGVGAVSPGDLQCQPGWFVLDQNYPNPFNATTSIHFEIGKLSAVNMTIYDLQGNKIKRLITDKEMTPGGYNVSWTGRNEFNQSVSSGIYLLEMRIDQYQQVKKMILMR